MNTRWQSLTGILGMALLSIALVLPGPPPKASDSAASLQASLVHHRSAFVNGVLLAAVGLMALLWFVGVLTATLRSYELADSARPAIALAGGVAGVMLIFVGMVLFSGIAFKVAEMGDHFVVRAAVDTGNMLIEGSKFAFAVLIFATCGPGLMGSRLSPKFVTAGQVAGALLVLSAFPAFLTDRGVGQFGGPIDLGGTVPGFLWLALLSLVLAQPLPPFRVPWGGGPSDSAIGIVSATETDFERFRDMPGAVICALRLRRVLRRSPGAIGVSLVMRPFRRRSWSLSAWETEADLRRFLASPVHRSTAARYRRRVTVRGETWPVEHFDLSEAWTEARARFSRGPHGYPART